MMLPLWFNDGPQQAVTRVNDISFAPCSGHLMSNWDPAETSFNINVFFPLICLLAGVVKCLMEDDSHALRLFRRRANLSCLDDRN